MKIGWEVGGKKLRCHSVLITIELIYQDIMDTTVLITMDIGMARDRLKMRLQPLDQTPTLMQMLMAMVSCLFRTY